MDTPLTIVEAYIPGAGDRDAAWFHQLAEQANRLLRPYGFEAALLALPEDETAMWLISSGGLANPGRGVPPDLDLPSVIASAIDFAGGHVIEREVGARLVGPDPCPPHPKDFRDQASRNRC